MYCQSGLHQLALANTSQKEWTASKIDGMRYQVAAMGITRVEAIIKIDEKHDKDHSLEDKLRSIEELT